MDKLKKSKYIFSFKRNPRLLYVSSTNNLYQINDNLYRFIYNLNLGKDEINESPNKEIIQQLHKHRIITTEEEDNDILELFRIENNINKYSKENLVLTIAPTISCNLRCPYCYEVNKPKHIMTEEICNGLINFINRHKYAQNLSITWYGGEPLIASSVMHYFLNNLNKVEEKRLVRHSMVTNATLLKGENLILFKKVPLDSIQITVDGMKNTHDKRRIKINEEGTYDEIVKNVTAFVKEYPQTFLSIRVNIDRNNAYEFPDVRKTFHNLFPNKKNMIVYPGTLRGCPSKDLNTTSFLEASEMADLNNLFHKKGFQTDYPLKQKKGCTATMISGYVIGPKGEIYKCWMDVGDESRVIGNIMDSKFSNTNLLFKYINHGSCTDDNKCLKCKFLPICNGGCPRERIANKFEKGNYDLCTLYRVRNAKYLKQVIWNYIAQKGIQDI